MPKLISQNMSYYKASDFQVQTPLFRQVTQFFVGVINPFDPSLTHLAIFFRHLFVLVLCFSLMLTTSDYVDWPPPFTSMRWLLIGLALYWIYIWGRLDGREEGVGWERKRHNDQWDPQDPCTDCAILKHANTGLADQLILYRRMVPKQRADLGCSNTPLEDIISENDILRGRVQTLETKQEDYKSRAKQSWDAYRRVELDYRCLRNTHKELEANINEEVAQRSGDEVEKQLNWHHAKLVESNKKRLEAHLRGLTPPVCSSCKLKDYQIDGLKKELKEKQNTINTITKDALHSSDCSSKQEFILKYKLNKSMLKQRSLEEDLIHARCENLSAKYWEARYTSVLMAAREFDETGSKARHMDLCRRETEMRELFKYLQKLEWPQLVNMVDMLHECKFVDPEFGTLLERWEIEGLVPTPKGKGLLQ